MDYDFMLLGLFLSSLPFLIFLYLIYVFVFVIPLVVIVILLTDKGGK